MHAQVPYPFGGCALGLDLSSRTVLHMTRNSFLFLFLFVAITVTVVAVERSMNRSVIDTRNDDHMLEQAVAHHRYGPLRTFHEVSDVVRNDVQLSVLIVVRGLQGELEGCSCSDSSIRGGLLQLLYVIREIESIGAPIAVLDAGQNLVHAQGLLDTMDLPSSYRIALDSLFDGTYDIDRDEAAISSENMRLESFSIRGVRHDGLACIVYIPNATRAVLKDKTDDVLLALAKFRSGMTNETFTRKALVDVLRTGFFIEYVPVRGRAWMSDLRLHEIRSRVLEEFYEIGGWRDVRDDSESCISCHSAEYRGWVNMGTHSNAWGTLRRVPLAQQNPFCVMCHSTAVSLSELMQANLTLPSHLQNVQCRSCHGNAERGHESTCTAQAVRPTVSTCSRCHTPTRRGSLEGATDFSNLRPLIGCTAQ